MDACRVALAMRRRVCSPRCHARSECLAFKASNTMLSRGHTLPWANTLGGPHTDLGQGSNLGGLVTGLGHGTHTRPECQRRPKNAQMWRTKIAHSFILSFSEEPEATVRQCTGGVRVLQRLSPEKSRTKAEIARQSPRPEDTTPKGTHHVPTPRPKHTHQKRSYVGRTGLRSRRGMRAHLSECMPAPNGRHRVCTVPYIWRGNRRSGAPDAR